MFTSVTHTVVTTPTFTVFIRYLEELAQMTGEMGNIKLLEGITVAVETLVGEVIFFMLSGEYSQFIRCEK